MNKFSFFDLRVYQESKQLVKDVYSLLEKFPKFEVYALIAEGSGRSSLKEKTHFLEIAYGSLTETLCQLDIAHDLSYISDAEFSIEKERINIIGKQLSGLRSSFQRQLEESANR